MCGIVGYITQNKIDRKILINMANLFSHRGPDAEGYYYGKFDQNKEIALAHKRLSILDLSENGKQPMQSENGNTITYNGEIYNFIEVREKLIKKGYNFKSKCDTEVILQAYEEWGIDCVQRFNGMFAFCIYDKRKEEVFLARDRIGKKPLYYYYDDGNLVFTSDIKAFSEYPYFKKELNLKSLDSFLWNHYIVAPNTIFKNTYKLEQGSILKYKDNSISIIKYWDLVDKFNNKKVENGKSEKECTEELEALLSDAVSKRMIADVPMGVFLSGGIDSSLIAALAQRNSNLPINTFSIGFYEQEYNEAQFAKEISRKLGTKHFEEYISMGDALKIVRDVPRYFTEPFADNSQLPMLLLSKFSKEQITVALSGDGGDELFCGYTGYESAVSLNKIRPLMNLLKPFTKTYSMHKTDTRKYWKVAKLFNCTSLDNIYNLDYFTSKTITRSLFDKEYPIEENYYTSKIITENIQERKMVLDMVTYLPDDIMVKVDRATMAYSLEARAPFLDYRVVEKSFQIPHQYKYKDGIKKNILKNILYQYVPKELMDRPKKGFGVPFSQWLHGDFMGLIDEYFDREYIRKQGVFNEQGIQQFIINFKSKPSVILDNIMWSLLMFQMWYEENF